MVEQYVRLALAGFHRHSAYGSAAVAGVAANVVFALVRAAVLLAVVSDERPVGGYDQPAVITYVWLSQGLYALVLVWGDSDLAQRVHSGGIVVDLSRPWDLQLTRLASDLGRASYAVPTRLLPPVAIGAALFAFRFPERVYTWALFVVSVLLAIVVSFAARFIANLAAFWMIETRGLHMLYGVLAGVLSGVTLPLSFFPEWTRMVMWCTPFPAMLQAPIDVFTERGTTGAVLAHQALFAAVLLSAGRLMQRAAQRRLVVHGG